MIHGHVTPGFEPVARLFSRILRRTGGGAALCAYLCGEPVIDLHGGVRDASGDPWSADTACVSFSTTKGVIATALHVLVDQGLVDYDRPVAHYWPEFAQNGKAAITVREVLCHRSGLFDVRNIIEHADQLLDWECMVRALAAAPARPLPAGSTAYQPLTWGYLVGEVMRRASGREIPDIVREELAEPLGLNSLFVGGPDVDMDRAARLMPVADRGRGRRDATPKKSASRPTGDHSAGDRPRPARGRESGRRRQKIAWSVIERTLRALGHPISLERTRDALAPRGISRLDFSSEAVLRAVIPAANGMFTADSLARLYAALAAGGKLAGARILTPETLARATEIQTRGYDQIILFPMRWRLGYHQLYTLRGAQPRAFGHFGWGGSGAWADMERDLAMGYVVNTGTGTPVGDLRITRLSSALIRCVDRR